MTVTQRRGWRGLIGVLAALLLAAAHVPLHPAQAQTWENAIATLDVLEGAATIAYPGPGDNPLTEGRQTELAAGEIAPVAVGDQITIADDGEALLTFFEGESTRLTAGTVITVARFETSGSSSRVTFNLLAGQTLSAVNAILDAESEYEVNTPSANITVRGTSFVVFVREDNLSQVAAIDGTVSVSAQGQSTEVPCGFGLKATPADGLGPLLVWGNARLNVQAPDTGTDLDALPVTMTNQDNGHIYRYRAGDPMLTVALGVYDLLLNTPGPVLVPDLDFPQDTLLLFITDVDIALGAVAFEVQDSEAGDLVVTLAQGDLVGKPVTAPAGAPLLAGPGEWTATIAPASAPEQTQTVTFSVTAGAIVTVPVAFDAAGS